MPSLAAWRCLFRLMRLCFLSRWIFLLVSERFCLVWKCHLFDFSTFTLFALTWRPIPAAARSKLCSSVSAWLGVFTSIAMSFMCVCVCVWIYKLRSRLKDRYTKYITSIDLIIQYLLYTYNRSSSNEAYTLWPVSMFSKQNCPIIP